RADTYRVLLKLNKMGRKAMAVAESGDGRFWQRTASRMGRKATKLEKLSAEMSQVTALMLSSFRVVCSQAKPGSMEQALRLFNEDDPATLQWKMKEDVAVLFVQEVEFNTLKGQKYEMNRVCETLAQSLSAIRQSSVDIFGACEAVITAQSAE